MLCDDLEGWDGAWEEALQEGDICVCMLIQFVVQQKLI